MSIDFVILVYCKYTNQLKMSFTWKMTLIWIYFHVNSKSIESIPQFVQSLFLFLRIMPIIFLKKKDSQSVCLSVCLFVCLSVFSFQIYKKV